MSATGKELQDRLAEIIDMLLVHYPLCLRVLVGEAEPPTVEEMGIMCALQRGRGKENGKKVRASGIVPTDEENAEAAVLMQVVEQAGGWRHIAATTREWMKENPTAWLIVSDCVIWIGGKNVFRKQGSMLDRLAAKFGVHHETLGRYRREFLGKLAAAVLKVRRGETNSATLS